MHVKVTVILKWLSPWDPYVHSEWKCCYLETFDCFAMKESSLELCAGGEHITALVVGCFSFQN